MIWRIIKPNFVGIIYYLSFIIYLFKRMNIITLLAQIRVGFTFPLLLDVDVFVTTSTSLGYDYLSHVMT